MKISVVGLLMVLSLNAWAQQDTSKLGADWMLELTLQELLNIDVNVEVASTQGEHLFTTPSTVTVISKRDIDSYGYQSVAEILQAIPGMSVYRTYLKKNLPTARGILQDHYANKVLVMINGVPSWHAVTGEGNIDRININDIERIEVLKGPASVLYGTNAYSGAINVVLRKSKDTGADIYLGLGSNGSFTSGANARLVNDKMSLFISGSGSEFPGPKMTFVDESGQSGVLRDRLTTNAFTIRASNKSQVFLFNANKGLEGYFGVSPNWSAGAGNNHQVGGYTGNYTFVRDLTEHLTISAGTTTDYGHRDLSRLKSDTVRSKISGYRSNTFVKMNFQLQHNISLDLGGDYEYRLCKSYMNYNTLQDTLLQDNNMRDKSVSEYSGFGQLNYSGSKFHGVLGLRYTQNQLSGGNLASRASLVYAIDSKNSIKLIYGESYRAPSLFELYFMTPSQTVFGSELLEPEKSRSVELAYLSQFNRFFFQGLIYYGIYDHIIHRSNDSTLLLPNGMLNEEKRSIYVNGSAFAAVGMEMELKYANPKVLNAFLNYNFIAGRKNDPSGENENDNFKYVPQHTVTTGFNRKIAHSLSLSGILNYWGSTAGPFGPIDAMQNLDIAIHYRSTVQNKIIDQTLSVKNILDNQFLVPEYVRRNTLNSLPYGYYRCLFYTVKITF